MQHWDPTGGCQFGIHPEVGAVSTGTIRWWVCLSLSLWTMVPNLIFTHSFPHHPPLLIQTLFSKALSFLFPICAVTSFSCQQGGYAKSCVFLKKNPYFLLTSMLLTSMPPDIGLHMFTCNNDRLYGKIKPGHDTLESKSGSLELQCVCGKNK